MNKYFSMPLKLSINHILIKDFEVNKLNYFTYILLNNFYFFDNSSVQVLHD